MSEKQTGFITELQGEVDKAIAAALEKLAGFKADFTTQIRQAANDALLEAKKPLYDQTQTRANEAAIRAGESWWEGLLRALGDILIGFIILIIVAVIVAAIAAAFGVMLTAWTAIMIAGAILLAVGLILALVNRYKQARDGGHSYAIMFWALGDVTGVTMMYEAFWAHADAVTGQPLSEGEATYRGFTGVFTAVMLVLGARSAIKGPPGGMFTRPGGIAFEFPQGGWGELIGGLRETFRTADILGGLRDSFVGLKEMLPAMWEAAKATFTDIITGLVQQGKEIINGIRERLGRTEPARPTETDPAFPNATLRAEVSKSSLKTSTPRYQQGGEGELSQWVWELIAETPEGPAVVSDQYVYTDGPNNPVSGPEQFLRPKQGRLPDGRIIEVKLNDGSWTTESLRMAQEAFRKQFGFTPTNLTGELAEANLRNFQTEFDAARTRNPGGNRQSWSDEAIRNISFGKQRIAMGYDQITTNATGNVDITVTDKSGNTRVINDVPDHVSVDARSSGNPTISPPHQPDDDQQNQ